MSTSFNTNIAHTQYNSTQSIYKSAEKPSQSPKVGEPQDNARQEKIAAVHGNFQLSALSPETINYIIQLQIEAGETASTRQALQASHTELRQEHFDRLMTDRDYAAQEARKLSQSIDTTLISNEVFEAYAANGRVPPGGYDLSRSEKNPALEMRDQRIALYEREVAKGAEPLDIISKLLEFNANISDDYWRTIDPAHLNTQSALKDIAKNQLDEFQYYMAAANKAA